MILSESTGDGIPVGESKTRVGCILLERHLASLKQEFGVSCWRDILNLEVVLETRNILCDVDATDGGSAVRTV